MYFLPNWVGKYTHFGEADIAMIGPVVKHNTYSSVNGKCWGQHYT